jgi:hypothetical protein
MKMHNIYLSMSDDDFALIYDALKLYARNRQDRAEEVEEVIDTLYDAMEDAVS